MEAEYDVIVIGAGPAGEHAVGRATEAGLSTLIVESELAGGECSYWACMPSKTLLRPTQVLHVTAKVPGAREAITATVDVNAALARRNWMVSEWDDAGQVGWVEGTGATFVRGRGRLVAERLVEVEASDGSATRYLARRAVIIAVGSDPVVPPIPGLAETSFWTNREATAAQVAPESLLVLGGGPVGVELAQAWRRLGTAHVAVIEAESRLLPTAEPFASEMLADAFAQDGIELYLGRRATQVVPPDANGATTVTLDDRTTISASELLVCVGRRPRTSHLNLEAFGLAPGKAINVDSHLRVSGVPGDWLYAIGDASGIALLTHMGKYQGRIAVRSILGEDVDDVADHGAVPAVVFTDPQVASVGMSEAAARASGRSIRTARVDLGEVAGAAIAEDGISGAAQLVVDDDEGCIVGATFVGPEVADWLHAATIAVVGRVPIQTMRHAVAAFPTMSEVWLELVERLFDPAKR
jgi:pyruvate/2-oxoglutarate dehydrogenase complex dihydrolipoamide dehydrogenase (E3) component